MKTPDGPPPIPNVPPPIPNSAHPLSPPPLPAEAFSRPPLTPPPLPPEAMAPVPSSDASAVVPEVIELTRQGLALLSTRRTEECESLLRRALALAEPKLGASHTVTADCLSNLGEFLSRNGRYDEAEPILRRSVTAAEAAHGTGHAATGTAINNLALVFRRTGRFAEAEPLYRRALTIFEAAEGPESIHVAEVCNNLAQVLQHTGHPDEAESLLRWVIELFIKHFGPDHENVAIPMNNLARLLAEKGRPWEAEPFRRRHLRIFAIFKEKSGNTHAYTNAAANGYGELLTSMGLTFDQARERIVAVLTGQGPGAFPATVAKPASPEPDFDELARRASKPDAGIEARNALYAAVFRLEQWQFIARGELPDVQPYFCTNPSIADGLPMVKAFTDGRRLHAFAQENNLLGPDGKAMGLSLPVPSILPTMEAFAEQGIVSIHFNPDRASDGFYAPLRQLRAMRRHLEEHGLI